MVASSRKRSSKRSSIRRRSIFRGCFQSKSAIGGTPRARRSSGRGRYARMGRACRAVAQARARRPGARADHPASAVRSRNHAGGGRHRHPGSARAVPGRGPSGPRVGARSAAIRRCRSSPRSLPITSRFFSASVRASSAARRRCCSWPRSAVLPLPCPPRSSRRRRPRWSPSSPSCWRVRLVIDRPPPPGCVTPCAGSRPGVARTPHRRRARNLPWSRRGPDRACNERGPPTAPRSAMGGPSAGARPGPPMAP